MLSDALLDARRAQDPPHGALTTEALGITHLPGRVTFAARGAMTLALFGGRAAPRLDSTRRRRRHGGGRDLLIAEGPAGALRRAWKVAQTLVAGGITAANATYAATGCGLLVTSAPYFAPPADVKVTIEAGITPIRRRPRRREQMKISARNVLPGKVVGITKGAVTSHVLIDVGGVTVTASITNESVAALGLTEGAAAYAVVKASDVMVGID